MCFQQKINPGKSKHSYMYYFSLLDLITDRSNEHSVQESNSGGNTEQGGTAPESREMSNQPSRFMEFEKTQLSFFLYIKN